MLKRASGELKIYEDANAYKLGKTAEESYMNNVAGLINAIAIDDSLMILQSFLSGRIYLTIGQAFKIGIGSPT